jgi:hypothetical protein
MGGMCEAKISGSSEEEMIANGMKHLEAAHPEMAETVKTMEKDNPIMVEWAANFHKAYEAAPDA